MRRRETVLWLGTALLGGCGGGGGGTETATAGPAGPGASLSANSAATTSSTSPAPSASSAVALPPPATRSIALWGDSMLPGVARAFNYMVPGRSVHDGGYPGETSMQVLEHQRADTERREWITVFWYGHNNVRIDAPSAPAQVLRDLAASTGLLAANNKRFVVLSLVNNADDARAGSAQYEIVMRINREIAAAYPNNYLDIRSLLVAQNAPGSPDLAADVPAASMRGENDPIHLNGQGAEFVAKELLAYFERQGW